MIKEKNRARSRIQMPRHRPREQGFTLVELIILMAILAILYRFSVPAFQDLTMANRMTSQINMMVSSFNLARSEAVKRHQSIVLCPNNAGQCAKQPYWHNGWLMFVDNNYDRELDEGEEIIYIEAAKEKIEITSSRYRRRVVFRALGSSSGSNASFIFCDQRGSSKARAVILANSGRARVAKKQRNGKEWKCNYGSI